MGESKFAGPELEKLEREFFSSIILQNNSSKMTFSDRLPDLHLFLSNYLEKACINTVDLLDVGCSSGISTTEFVVHLRGRGITVRAVASDLTLYAYLVKLCPMFYALTDVSGFPLQYDLFGYGLRPWCRKRYKFLGGELVTSIMRAAYKALSPKVLTAIKSGKGTSTNAERLLLLSPTLLAQSGISFVEDDLEGVTPPSLRNRFDLIHAANIINLNYFSKTRITKIIDNLRERLKGPGSLLLVCRTQNNGRNDATLFCLDETGHFQTVSRLNQGSEIEELVVTFAYASNG